MENKTILLAAICLAVVVTFSGCIGDSDSNDVTDCTDAENVNKCMNDALQACSPAKVTMGGLKTEITGLSDGECVVEYVTAEGSWTCSWPEELYSADEEPPTTKEYCPDMPSGI